MRAYRVLPDRIWHEMGRRALSQIELAEISGVPKETINRILHGKVPSPQKKTLERIAAALGVEVQDITESTYPLALV